MKTNLRRMMTGLAFASCIAMVSSACRVRVRGHLRVRPAVVVVDDTNPPPAPRYATVAPRTGQVWVRGRWEWRTNRWVWRAGSWQNARANYRWNPGRWERRGNRYHWVEGSWVAAGTRGPVVRDHRRPPPAAYPTAAPPAPRYTNPAARSGYVWVRGRYQWRTGRWVWSPGRWQRSQANKVWVAGRWQRRGNRYVWVAGRWTAGAAVGPGPVVRDHRAPKVLPYPTTAPPAARYVRPGVRGGYIWVRGAWQWRGGRWQWTAGRWQRARAGKAWTPGHWQRQGNRYVWIKGSWRAGVKVRDHRRKKPPVRRPHERQNERVRSRRAN